MFKSAPSPTTISFRFRLYSERDLSKSGGGQTGQNKVGTGLGMRVRYIYIAMVVHCTYRVA